MNPPLLQTKLYIPPVRAEYVPRNRLLAMVEEGLSHKLTLVSAPAGYGKTSLLSEWASRGKLPCAWLSLDRFDNDLQRFLEYLSASLRTVQIEVDREIPSPPQHAAGLDTTSLVPFINTIAAAGCHFALILDDFHRIQNQQVNQALGYLLENLPPNMHLVVATRIDPTLRLAKLRAQGALCEIRAEDLRFREEEAVAFLNQSMKLGLLPTQIAALTAKTEGWITGLQLAAISLQTHPDKGSFLKAFAGDDRYIADYLVDEALARQTPDVQDFLRQASILDCLCAPLCDAITGREDSQEILSQLDQANLFLIPLDNARSWYRFHHLFQDLLLHRLQQTSQAESLAALHRRASDWYLSNNQVFDAIQHAFEADDMQQIVHLIEANIFTMLDQGGIRLLLRWLDLIPGILKADRPWLNIAHALVQAYAGNLEPGESALKQAEQELSCLEEGEADRAQGYIYAIRAYSFWMKGLAGEAGNYARQALALIPEGDRSLQAFATMVLGATQIHSTGYEAASQALEESMSLARTARSNHIYLLASSHLIYLLLQQAQFNQAEGICREVLAHYGGRQGSKPPAIAQVYSMMASIFSIRLELDQALEFAQKGLEISKQWDQIDTITVCYIYLVETLIIRGEYDQAWAALEEVKALSLDVSPWFRKIIEETEAKIHLAAGNLDAVSHWAVDVGLGIEDGFNEVLRPYYRTYVRLLIAQGRWLEASQLLEWLIGEGKRIYSKGASLSLLPMKSVVLAGLGEQEQAFLTLTKALDLAEPEGYKRGFILLGERMMPLLRLAIEAGVHQVFAIQLLEAIAGRQPQKQGSTAFTPLGKAAAGDGLMDPLSKREIEVLQWLAKGFANQEIAQELVLSLYTVKSHIRHIFGKLGVKNRTEAVARARLLGLLDDGTIPSTVRE